MSLLKTIFDKPWDYQGEDPNLKGRELAEGMHPKRIALRMFLAVVFVLFMLFIVAYFIRMELDDWRPMPEPGLLWVNTIMLFLCSAVMQWTRGAAQKNMPRQVKWGMLVSGAFTLAFIFGQVGAWQELNNAGFFLASNPANAFFYVLTGLHGLHILGGLWVWTRSTFKAWSGTEVKAIRLSVELCAVYWHFLLLVWLIIFALLSYT
jgi:cytochrome c oxidase subunit 3